MTINHPPTPEQATAIEVFGSGLSMALDALAGTGKTTVLEMLAESVPGRRGAYMAFNKSIVTEASLRFPANVECRTVHSFAFQAVGKGYARRLRGGRMRGDEIARRLGVDPYVVSYGSQRKVLQPAFLAGHVMKAIGRFCQSADPVPARRHIAYLDGIDLPEGDGTRTWENNDRIRDALEPLLAKAWKDLSDPDGQLPFRHDCQPPGTLVRRVVRYGGANRHTGESWDTAWEDVPIEQIRIGDRVSSWNPWKRLGLVRRVGRLVTQAGQRDYSGELVTIETQRGRRSSYTTEHRCIVRIDAALADGNQLVYIARRGSDFRVGRTTWRTSSQHNALGLRRRAEAQRADAMWVLSVHGTDAEAALAEALTAHRFRLPSWQFQAKNETMPLAQFWDKCGNNQADAAACLSAFGRDIRFPFWQRGDGWETTRRPVEMRACNLLAGMLVLEPDEIGPDKLGALAAHDGAGGWSAISVRRSPYDGPVHSLEVEEDHTYVADGIVTHNCYVKIWAQQDPRLGVDFLLLDECQDLAPVMLQIAQAQRDCQLVLVGDANQSIYSWRGSIDAMSVADVDARATLTQSFRFGQPIADVANWILGRLPTDLRVTGWHGVDSAVRAVPEPRAILTRSNAGGLEIVFDEQRRGRRPCLLGGGSDVASFARAAGELMDRGHTGHPELACFDSWPQVQQYVENDPQGDELGLLVRLVDSYGVATILEALERMPSESDADVVVSTAHKAKGREWRSVQVHADFKRPDDGLMGYEEWRLLYVAATRAQEALDISACPAFAELLAPPKTPRPVAIPLPPAAHERPVVEPISAAAAEPADARSTSAQALLDLLK